MISAIISSRHGIAVAVTSERNVSKRSAGVGQAAREELRLLESIRAGDRQAFEQLYRLYHPRLTRFLMNLVRRPQLVEEVLNDTLMVVWERADSFNGASKLSTWIFGIGYRKAMKALRRQQDPLDDPEADRMTYGELKRYIGVLQASGYHVVPYMVQLQRKVAFPFVTLIMTLLAVPFAVTTGRSGAIYGVGAGIVLALVYWTMLSIFGAIGAGGWISPVLAAWAPNIFFGAAAAYLLLTVRT